MQKFLVLKDINKAIVNYCIFYKATWFIHLCRHGSHGSRQPRVRRGGVGAERHSESRHGLEAGLLLLHRPPWQFAIGFEQQWHNYRAADVALRKDSLDIHKKNTTKCIPYFRDVNVLCGPHCQKRSAGAARAFLFMDYSCLG